MPRKPEIDRPTRLEVRIPESIRAKLDLFLFSEVEGKVPFAKYQEFFIARILEFFESRRLDLEVYGFPAGYYVSGPKAMIEELEKRLKHG